MPNFNRLHTVEDELFHADGQTETHEKLTVDFRYFAIVPKNIK